MSGAECKKLKEHRQESMQMRLAITIFYNSPTARTGRWKVLSVTRTNQGGYEPLLILYSRCSVTINVKFKTLSRNWFRIRVFVLTSEFGRTSWEDRCFWIKIQDTIDNQKVLENRLRESQTVVRLVSQGPQSQILMTVREGGGGGVWGVRQRFIFYTQKNHKFRICLSQKIP